jgi:hypothetical protein
MSRLLHGNSLIPPGLKVEEVSLGTGVLLVSARLLAIRHLAHLAGTHRRVSIAVTSARSPICQRRGGVSLSV